MGKMIVTDKERYSYLDTYKSKTGYYYYKFSHSYEALTDSQTDRFEGFVLKQVAERMQTPLDFIHLEDSSQTNIVNGVTVVKYVKLGEKYMGKIVFNYMMINPNRYNVDFTFLDRSIIPRSTQNNHSLFQNKNFKHVNGGKRYHKKDYRKGRKYVRKTWKDRKVE